MGLKELLVSKKPREESATSAKYDYQKDVSIVLLLQQHDRRGDYVFIFDYHDDLLIINSAELPNTIDFYQIKSKEKGNWSLNNLIKPAKGENLSIISKMYVNKINFTDYTKSLNFISNTGYYLDSIENKKLTDEALVETKHLSKDVLTNIISSIKAHHSLSDDPVIDSLLIFHKTTLSLEDSSSHCAGLLGKFLEQLSPGNQVNTELAYQKIFNEIRIKTNAKLTAIEKDQWETIIEKKGISKAFFGTMLAQAGLYKSLERTWEDIAATLRIEGVGFLEISRLKASWRTVNATILGEPGNIPLQETVHYIDDVITSCKADPASHTMNLTSLMGFVQSSTTRLPHTIFDQEFIKALILRQLNHD